MRIITLLVADWIVEASMAANVVKKNALRCIGPPSRRCWEELQIAAPVTSARFPESAVKLLERSWMPSTVRC
ncbi:MAG TPA: hypothetical protein VFR60_10475 [Sphingomicrobium sp.]|nr:hypothetical protein [Sphingomicrobium sp.]